MKMTLIASWEELIASWEIHSVYILLLVRVGAIVKMTLFASWEKLIASWEKLVQ